MQKFIEFNENQDTPLYFPFHLEDLKHKLEYFEVPDLETRIQRHDNPQFWLQKDILQVIKLPIQILQQYYPYGRHYSSSQSFHSIFIKVFQI